MTVQYLSNAYHGGAVPIGNASWRSNTFNGVLLIVDALPIEFVGNQIRDCQFEFPPNGITPMEFADWLESSDRALASALRDWVANGGWQPPTVH